MYILSMYIIIFYTVAFGFFFKLEIFTINVYVNLILNFLAILHFRLPILLSTHEFVLLYSFIVKDR